MSTFALMQIFKIAFLGFWQGNVSKYFSCNGGGHHVKCHTTIYCTEHVIQTDYLLIQT
jgi:hypothetical protein